MSWVNQCAGPHFRAARRGRIIGDSRNCALGSAIRPSYREHRRGSNQMVLGMVFLEPLRARVPGQSASLRYRSCRPCDGSAVPRAISGRRGWRSAECRHTVIAEPLKAKLRVQYLPNPAPLPRDSFPQPPSRCLRTGPLHPPLVSPGVKLQPLKQRPFARRFGSHAF